MIKRTGRKPQRGLSWPRKSSTGCTKLYISNKHEIKSFWSFQVFCYRFLLKFFLCKETFTENILCLFPWMEDILEPNDSHLWFCSLLFCVVTWFSLWMFRFRSPHLTHEPDVFYSLLSRGFHNFTQEMSKIYNKWLKHCVADLLIDLSRDHRLFHVLSL